MARKKSGLTHVAAGGEARMVDVSVKQPTQREAIARGEVRMRPATLKALLAGNLPKGEVLGTARIAGIQAAKQTPALIPLCHPLRLASIDIDFAPVPSRGVLKIEARVKAHDVTGVEMEALLAVSVAALTVYDMAKAVDPWMTVGEIGLVKKTGGKRGSVSRPKKP